jgi:hypothetical protein
VQGSDADPNWFISAGTRSFIEKQMTTQKTKGFE